MKKYPTALKGIFLAPVLICIFFVLKASCSEVVGESCFADRFAVPIFLPIVIIYRMFGDFAIIGNQQFLVVMLYWAAVGALIGFILDLYIGRSQYSPAQRLLLSQTSAPESLPRSPTQPTS